jgi:hypothetical protein
MARKPATSEQAAKQSAKPTPEASLLNASVLSIVGGLEGQISMGCAVNGAPTWAASLPPISRAGC